MQTALLEVLVFRDNLTWNVLTLYVMAPMRGLEKVRKVPELQGVSVREAQLHKSCHFRTKWLSPESLFQQTSLG